MLVEQESKTWWDSMVDYVVKNVHYRHQWVNKDDVYSAALISVVRAKAMYDHTRNASLETFVKLKATFLTIDELRHDGTLVRKHLNRSKIKTRHYGDMSHDIEVDGKKHVISSQHNAMDGSSHAYDTGESKAYFWSLIIKSGLSLGTIRLLYLIFSKGVKQIQVAKELGVSESAVSYRVKRAVTKLKKLRHNERRELKESYL